MILKLKKNKIYYLFLTQKEKKLFYFLFLKTEKTKNKSFNIIFGLYIKNYKIIIKKLNI
jgi:hypothetical protein